MVVVGLPLLSELLQLYMVRKEPVHIVTATNDVLILPNFHTHGTYGINSSISSNISIYSVSLGGNCSMNTELHTRCRIHMWKVLKAISSLHDNSAIFFSTLIQVNPTSKNNFCPCILLVSFLFLLVILSLVYNYCCKSVYTSPNWYIQLLPA